MHNSSRSARAEMFFGFVIALLGILFLAVLIPYGIQAPQRAMPYAALSPYLLPRVMAALLVVTGLAVSTFAWSGRRASHDEAEEKQDVYRGAADATGRCLCACVLFLGYYALIPYLGLAVASVAGWIVLALLYGETRLAVLGFGSAGLAAGLYLFFTQIAQVPLPPGAWFHGL